VPRTFILVTPLGVTGIMTTTPAQSACNGKSTAIYGSKSRGMSTSVGGQPVKLEVTNINNIEQRDRQ
jgi:hypothetical protein